MDTAARAVAVVGVGAILPDALSAPAFWQNIVNKRYSISDVPPERWSPADYFDPDPKAPDKTYAKIGGWVRGYEFDWRRFRIPPKVADAMDQGQQWALTIAAEALADYGYPERPLPTERTAVVLGTAMGGELHYITNQRIAFPEYAHALAAVPEFAGLPAATQQTIIDKWRGVVGEAFPKITEDSMPGELPNIVSGRVANVLNLRGPNFITDAACASSLAALEAAIEMLVEHKVDAAVTGGVDRNMGASTFVKFCKIGALSATGTRPFAAGADGFVMGEGAGAFLLKRLEDAERDGDRIYAVIRGVGGSSDGKGKGITAPNPVGQELAIERAWENAGLKPATATLIEAHGTSTRVGDVVEVESLARVFGGAPRGSIGLGSAKSNIGHLKAGAGAAGLLKATMALHHKVLPPTLNASPSNPNINFSDSPFFLVHDAQPWRSSNDTPRRCGVSAYGFGGTNFHVVLEEYVRGTLRPQRKVYAAVDVPANGGGQMGSAEAATAVAPTVSIPAPVRGILALGAQTPAALAEKLAQALQKVEGGWTPPLAAPDPADLQAAERLVIDFGDHDELLARLQKAHKVMGKNDPQVWSAMEAQGIFRGSGDVHGKVAFMFPGQGSQYVNMGRNLAAVSPVVAEVFAEADRVMEPILGKPLTSYIFVDGDDKAAVMQAQIDLMQTEITQPAMLTLDIAILKLLATYGFHPDMVVGHSLGEYAALVAAGVMPFAEALEAAAARGDEMSKVVVADNGKMAAIIAPYNEIEAVLNQVQGYVVPANINSKSQCVIGGSSAGVDEAVALFEEKGFRAIQLPVSHAFHTEIVAPASKPLREVLDRLHIAPPQLPLIANVTGGFYPTTVDAIKDILEKQIASPVQWVRGLHTLHDAGVRTFVEVGPKRALWGFARDVFKDEADVTPILTNHPKKGDLPTFNLALCALYAAGYGEKARQRSSVTIAGQQEDEKMIETKMSSTNGTPASMEAMAQMLAQAVQQAANVQTPATSTQPQAYDRNTPPTGSVVISGTGLGLPGAEKSVMDPDNALRILRGEQFVDLIPERFRKKILAKRITRLVKGPDGSGRFETITDPDEVIKLAGRPGYFDLHEEYGVPKKLIQALDSTTQLAIAAGLDAMREAGIPLVQTYRRTTTDKFLPDRWRLPQALRDETGVIFASAFPGGDRFADEFERYYTFQNRLDQLQMLQDLRAYTQDNETLREIDRRIHALRDALEREPYTFDRRFLFRILAMGHSQFAEYIGARGPNTQVNAACASTAQAVAIAEDWIRNGRCRRVIVIGADNVTGDNLMEWVGAGFLAVGAAATDDRVDEAALPFDRRRHGTLMGMGACGLVVESEDAVRERGMRGIVELLSCETNNSAFHGTRLDVNHIAQVMNSLVTSAERRFGLNRYAMAPQMVFMSHETYTPARGGSAAAEVEALRHTFGESAREVIVANTKGFTGHPMGVGVEDVIAVKILEYGIVPPVPNFREVDPTLGPLNLSRGGRYPVQYALHLAAGFGSQISMTLTRRIPGALNRVDSQPHYQRWLDEISGYNQAQTYVEKRVLRIEAEGVPQRTPAASPWQPGTGPVVRTLVGRGEGAAPPPARMATPAAPPAVRSTPPPVQPAPSAAPPPQPAAETPKPAPAPAQTPVAAAPTPAPAAAPPEPAQPQVDGVTAKVLAIVADQTGYPEDMLDLDLDLEADLGIDTVKQAETFAAIRDEFDIPRRDDLQLRDYPTLEKVIGFVHEMRPELRPQEEAGGAPTAVPAPAAPAPVPTGQPPAALQVDSVTAKVLAIVADQTGYPEDMLDLDLDLEADLGIDTVKQAETFAAIRDEFDIPRRDDLQLRDYPTLEKVIGFVHEMRPELRPQEGGSGAVAAEPTLVAAPPAPAAAADPTPATDPVTAKVLAIVAGQTGYPEDMLELDLDMEADLGIDTVKQAETFAAIREEFDIPRRDDLQLRDYPTLEKVIGFVHEMRPDLKAKRVAGAQPAATTAPATPAATTVPQKEAAAISLENADRMPRRVPVPIVRPSLDLCKPTGVTLGETSRVIVALDRGGVGKSLVGRLEKLGVTVLPLTDPLSGDEVTAQVETWLAAGPIQGVYWLTALDAEPELVELDLEAWRDLNRQRVKNLYATMRVLYDAVSQPDNFLVSATRLGGKHGYGAEGATAPLGGAVVGFTKAYKRERAEVLVKAVDFPVSRKTAAFADALIAETTHDPGVVEVGYQDDVRFGVGLVERPLTPADPVLTLDENSVIVVTGAAGGITSAIVADLAAASGSIFYLLDLVDAPARDDAQIALFRSDKDALKKELIAAARADGERPTPVVIERRLLAVERSEAALAAIESVEAAGGTAHYHSVNLLDGAAVTAVVDEIRSRHEKIDALIHAGGLEISRPLPKKEAKEFELVFDVKADGFFSLLRAAGDMPIGATVVFSSVAGRFGNSGQTDYSAANDLLCKLTSSLRRWRPETRGIAIDWSAWGEIGMATRGSIPRIMEMAGIEMLPPDVGIPTVRRELLHGGGELVVGGTLGILTAEWDETGGLDVAKANAWLQENYGDLLLVGEIKAAKLYGGLEVETTLDPQVQPFLFDHAPDEGTPWLPGVMATEALAELATVLLSGYAVTAVANEEMSGAFKFFRNQPRTLYLNAYAEPVEGDAFVAHATLRSVTKPAREGLSTREQQHFAADIHLQPQPLQKPTIEFEPPAVDDLPIASETIYQAFFHGPAYQVIERAGMAESEALGLVPAAMPPNSNPETARTLMAPRLVEACFQLAALWTQEVKQAMGFPLGIGSVTVYRQALEAADKRLYALVTTADDGETFDGKVVDAAGNVYVDLCGYRTVARPLS